MLNKIYLKSPLLIQNMAITIYGAKMYYERFRGKIPEIYDNIDIINNELTSEQINKQEKRFKMLIAHCIKYVPYYKKYLNESDLNNITTSNVKNYLPKLTKLDIIGNYNDLLSMDPKYKKNTLKLNTSGSTGTPLNIISSYEARRLNYYFYERILNKHKVSYRHKSTTFAGRVLCGKNEKDIARYDKFNNTQYLSAYHISYENIFKYITALNKWKPEFIDSYPSALVEIQQLAIQKDLKLEFSPKFILTSAETLNWKAREQIESFFGCNVVDHYGCTEMAVSAFSFGGKYYVNPLCSVLELEHLYDDSYSLIATGLLNYAMPLIRYEIGDCVTTGQPQVPYIFDKVEGRVDDVIITPEGRRVGRIDPAFKGVDGIELAQVVQEKINRINVKIVTNDKYFKINNERLLIENIKNRTSHKMEVNITYHKKIEKEINGKFKSVLSNIK
ncbi:phenylacetate-coenzyme A ligase PaaK, adenylate-forming domain family [Desulfuromonas soudanensis]|uniref:Phenylacetate-coenzyme A ligase PaaK, adenylate-forming domain family n=1 Tax=Desulfuromonas soudanensis TaxID=1603606 RepID=A0A0M3QFX9_9BACT|nr:phenylacetate--CoA ligase family protein [Desulfuromonas soudanensis]ALC16853.1 phenylacetate-coenzyme A ligase PaaK, adenylate-forming domain family [Desulfuromonas soudanensis]